MDSALRPRDIQSRIRHGESPESVARAAGVTVDQLMPYAGPVLAERFHVAQRAQRSSLRRRQPDSSTNSRALGDAVAGVLRREGVDPEAVEWDAWRRDDGRWTLEAVFPGPRAGAARFTYDTAGNYVTLDNDDARRLVGEVVAPPAAAEPTGPRRLLSAVASPTAEPLARPVPPPTTQPSAHTDPAGDGLGAQLSIEDELGADALDMVRDQPRDEGADQDEAGPTPPRTPARPAPPTAGSRRRGRASVPSWDEIMFGGQSE